VNAEPIDAHLAAGAERSRELPVVVIGGYEYSPAMNQISTMMVRELVHRRRVLYLNQEAHGALLRRVQGRARQLGPRDVVRTALGPIRPRRVEESLWLAPVRGLAAIGPLDVPETMRRRNVRLFARIIREWLADVGAPECTLLFYWWALPELVRALPCAASAYDCTDDHASAPGSVRRISVVNRLESQLLDAVDRAYVVSPTLLESRAEPGRSVSVLPSPFDLTLFERLRRDGFAVPPSLRSARHPVIGYAGGITSRMDWELLTELARRRPDWTLAFIGSDGRGAPAELVELGNVIFAGTMPYPQALAAISSFDVAMIPVRVTDFSRANSFLKLMDYFAHGLPTVATPVPDAAEAAGAGADAVYLADGADGWEQAIEQALAEAPDAPIRAARRARVGERSTTRRVDRILSEAFAR